MKKLITLLVVLAITNHLFAQFNWEHTNGPEGGNSFRIYSNNEYAFYPDQYFLYRSSDGENWEKLSEGTLRNIAANGSILMAIKYPNNTFASGETIWKISFDNGVSWSEINKPSNSVHVDRFAICDHGIYAEGDQDFELFRSLDDGMTWQIIASPVQYVQELWNFENRLYAVSFEQVWRTDDTGGNWEEVGPVIGVNEHVKGMIAFQENIIIGTDSSLWHSHNNGQTWNENTTIQFDKFTKTNNVIYGYGGSGGLAKSEDFGVTWSSWPIDSYYRSFWDMTSFNGFPLLASKNRGVVKWNENTQAYKECNNGLYSANIYGIEAQADRIWAMTGNGLSYFDTIQQQWSYIPDLLPQLKHFHTIGTEGDSIVAVAEFLNFKIHLSKNLGNTWETIDFTSSASPDIYSPDKIQIVDSSIFLSSIISSPFRSPDLGTTWSYMNAPFYYVSDMVEHNGQLFYAAFDDIIVSNDLGENWEVYSTFYGNGLIYLGRVGDYFMGLGTIAINGESKRTIFVSEDLIDWKYAGDGLPSIFDIGQYPFEFYYPYFFHDGIYYFYYEGVGFFASKDSCKTWLPIEPKRYHSVCLSGDFFYAGTLEGGGVIRSEAPNVFGEIIKGTAYFDNNNNGIFDAGELPFPNIKILMDSHREWSSYYFSMTDGNGEYSLGIMPSPLDTLKAIVPNKYVENINPPFYVADSGGGNKNFGIYLTPDITDVSIYGRYTKKSKPGFTSSLFLNYENIGTTETGATVSLRLDPKLEFLESTPSPTAIIGDSIVWDLGQLPLFDHGYIWVKTNVLTSASLGDPVKSTCRISPLSPDANLTDNVWNLCDTIVGAYDPNDKLVEPADGLTAEEIANGKELYYTVRFQNTGTYYAEKIRITDQLDTALNWPSFRLVAASHDITSLELLPGGLLQIVFDQIMLPDSNMNEPASQGFVTFAIQRNKVYSGDYIVKNHAAIYFDFNEPIFTNQTKTPLKEITPVNIFEKSKLKNNLLHIYPNPASGDFNILFKGNMVGKGFLQIYNVKGQLVKGIAIENLSETIKIKGDGLSDGLYHIKLTDGKNISTGKIILKNIEE